MFKIFTCGFVIFLNSFLVCFLINYNLILPITHRKEINFIFTRDKESLYSNVNFNSNFILCDNCLTLDKSSYLISLDLEISNRNYDNFNENYEAEIYFIHEKGDNYSIKKIFFFDRYDDFLIETTYKLMTLPFRLIGYFSTQRKEIIFTEEYDNFYGRLERIELFIHSKNINIKRGKINLIPKIGWVMYFISYFKIIALPLIFVFLIFSQIVIILILIYLNTKTKTLNM